MRRRKVLAQSVRFAVELLESRTLLSSTLALTAGTASITGVVFDDLFGDGVRDTGDPAAAGTTVTIKELGTVYASGTVPTVQTDANGGFYFTGLAAGRYDVNIVPQAGYTQDNPGTEFVTVSADDTVSVAVGQTNVAAGGGSGTATITGTLFDDVTQSGVYNPLTEDFLAGDYVYLDLNGSGALTPNDPETVTNSIGQFSFSVTPGSYEVRVIPRPGFHQDPPGYSQVTIYSDQTVNQNIGENNRATINGSVFVDTNGNGIQDAGELSVAGETVFIDDNFSGVYTPGTYDPTTGGFDAGDPNVVTNASGEYSFTGLTPGTYRLEIVSSVGLLQDQPGFVDVTLTADEDLVQNLGEGQPASVSGVVYNDLNGSGTKTANDPGIINQLVFLDTNSDGVYDETGVYPDGKALIGPTTTYTLPFSANLTLDEEPDNISDILAGQTAEMTLAAGNTTVLSALAADDAAIPSGNTKSIGDGPSGVITNVDDLTATISLTNLGTTAQTVTVTDANDTGGGGGTGGGTGGSTSTSNLYGTVVGVDVATNQIELLNTNTDVINTYTLASDAVVTLDGNTSQLSALTNMITVTAAEPSQVTDVNGNYTIANLGPGTYTARLVVPTGAVATGPATATHDITFTLTSGETLTSEDFGIETPDLTTNILSISNTPVMANVSKKAVVRITNVGNLPADGLAGVTLWAQPIAGTVNTNAAYIIGTLSGREVHLQPGQSRTFSVTYAYPTQIPENSYYVSSEAVSSVFQTYTNNFSPAEGPIQVGPPYIDLSLAYASQPVPLVQPGDPTSISLALTNDGNTTTTGVLEFRIYVTSTPAIEPSDDAVLTRIVSGVRLKPGRTRIVTFTIPNPGPNLGFRYIDTYVDSGDPLGETNLLNNTAIPTSATEFE